MAISIVSFYTTGIMTIYKSHVIVKLLIEKADQSVHRKEDIQMKTTMITSCPKYERLEALVNKQDLVSVCTFLIKRNQVVDPMLGIDLIRKICI